MRLIGAATIVFIITLTLATSSSGPTGTALARAESSVGESERRHQDDARLDLRLGQKIFREDTFGDEQLWTDVLQMHNVIGTVPPVAALGLGLKVDVDALPAEIIAAVSAGQGLTDPAVTVALLQLNAVVGVRAKVNDLGQVTSFGITCALCHSTVDDSLTAGVGHRLDGWANTSLDVGKIAALSPFFDDATKAEFRLWGPGKYNPRHHAFDGTNIISLNSPSLPVVIPPIYGLKGVVFETYTADGPISVLEQLRRDRADGRPGHVRRSTDRSLHPSETRSRDAEVAGAARVPTEPRHAAASGWQLRSRRRAPRQASLQG